jgi:biotin carboxylase
MTVLVLNHRPLDMRPIGQWIQDAGDLVMVTTRASRAASSAAERARFVQVVAVDNYASSEVDRAARTLADRHLPARVVSSNELDLIRTAVLRERYGLPGQDLASALAYRDKLYMRRAAAAGAVNVPRFQQVGSAIEMSRFAGEVGFPVVVKPRRGAGSAGITVVRRPEDLPHAAALGSRVAGGLIIEEYVDAPLYHVDGISVDGKVIHCWPSRYSNGALQTVQQCAPRVSMLLDALDPLRGPLQDFAVEVVGAFPASGSFAFHLEAWVDDRNVPILCEITSRTGGGPIGRAYEEAFGVSLYEESFRAQAGLALTLDEQPAEPSRYVGWVGFLAGRGTFTPPEAGRPPAVWFTTEYQPGRRCQGARIVSDAAAYALVDGASADQAAARGAELIGWWDAGRPWR